MAEITKSTVGKPSLSSLTPPASNRIIGQTGEAIAAGDACRVNSSGLIVRSDGSAATAVANVDGFADRDVIAGGDITIFRNERMHYGDALTPGANLYLSGTVLGGLADAASTGGTTPCAFVMPDGKRIQMLQATRR